MCTALSLTAGDRYFGRNLDLDRSYGEEICAMPRNFPLEFRKTRALSSHYAIMGMATIVGGIPLFYDAANEHGLSMAGLNFPHNAYYAPIKDNCDNIAPFELIPWILGQCKNISEAKELLSKINIADIAFSEKLPPSPLHWMISDRETDITLEAMKDGLHIYENPYGVLTNNPPFPYQIKNLENYKNLRNDNKDIKRQDYEHEYSAYCQGLGAVGLPGDVSSMSRFVRIVFGKENSPKERDELLAVGQFFHLLTSVSMLKGICKTDEGTLDITGYTACMNTTRGLYYYTTYENRRISCVDMHKTDLNCENISRFPLLQKQSIEYQN